MKPIVENIALIGLGLIGGSLAKALKNANFSRKITIYDICTQSTLLAEQEGFNITRSIPEAVKDADIIIICTPVSAFIEILSNIQNYILPSAIITDIASIKSYTTSLMEKYFSLDKIVPAHPIAGSHKVGFINSDASLFVDKKVILTPRENTNIDKITLIKRLWEVCGAKICFMEPQKHDFIYANVSHVIQLIIYIYVLSIQKHDNSNYYKEFIRLGDSRFSLWKDIFLLNKSNILEALLRFQKGLEEIFLSYTKSDLKWLDKAKNTRKNLQSAAESEVIKNIEFYTLPQMIAASIILNFNDYNYIGPGYLSVTKILEVEANLLQHQSSNIQSQYLNFVNKLTILRSVISNNNLELLEKELENYQNLVDKKE